MKEQLFQDYYWPGMDTDIANHLQCCHECQLWSKADKSGPFLVTTFPQPMEPNHRFILICFDLSGLLEIQRSTLCITDEFTKDIELVALPNKEASTNSQAIVE